MLGKYLQFMYFVFLCSTHLCSGDKNTSVVYAVKNCVLSENASFLHGIVGHLFSDESDEKADYYFSVCGFKTEENSSVSLNQSIIAVSESSVVELGSFTNFTISNKGDRHLVRFNDSEIITDLILGCGSMAAFHLISHENDKSYSFDLFHPSLCSVQQSTKYTLTVILVCCLAFIVGYCVLSSLIKRYLYGRPWHQSVPFTNTFEHLKNRFQDYIVLHCHRPQIRLVEPVYMPVPNDSPERFRTKKNESICENSLEQKQLLLSNSDEQQDDILLAL
ncbi:unnamed protein product [Schistosoma margrebowiei]|uniref:Uncharacterized protein n=1 Tax=Schistosoma margrebowiei TaxID=48269 RepID=A0AA84ZCH2_9TREM|nr:unnamed protein product [Schistosoma margrebowiei]